MQAKITIPPEVVEAAARKLHFECAHESMDVCRLLARTAIRAALNAWTGFHFITSTKWKDGIGVDFPASIVLPLPQQEPRT